MMNILLAALIAVIVFCGYLIFDAYMVNQKRRESLRARISLDGSYGNSMGEESRTTRDGQSPRATAMAGLLKSLGINVEEAVLKLEPTFAHAGMNTGDGPIYYLFFQRIVSLGLCMVALLLFLHKAPGDGSNTLTQFLGFLVAVIALFGPKLYMSNKIEHRKKVLQRAFPDTLDLLLICVESGLALDAALSRVCNELDRAYPEMAAELNRTRLELALINDRVRALMNLGERTNMVAFKSLISSLIQSERFGTSLTDTLRVLSEEFRLTRLTNAETKAARLPVLLTIPLIFLLMPAFMMIVLGPAVVGFMK